MGIYVTVGIFIVFDVVTGFIKALYTTGLNSTALRKGLLHKLSELISVAGAGLLEYGLNYIHFGIELPLLVPVATYLCIMELISVIENLCVVNPALSKLFSPYLAKLKKGVDNNEDGN